jgi:hypothetical protein
LPELAHPVTKRTAFWRRTRWTRVISVIALVVIVLMVVGYFVADDLVARRLRPATIELLERRFNSDVELRELNINIFPTMSIRGEGLTLRHKTRRDLPPLITIRAFTISSTVRELWARHIDRVHVEGLEIMIPPRRGDDLPEMKERSESRADSGAPDVFIHELLAEGGLLTIMPKRDGKRPRVFQLRTIRFDDFQFATAMPFEAAITNPVPEGEIAVTGRFGPWQADEPSLTPVEGTFVFDADLGTIKGIGGAMHAKGTFGGPLERIETRGRTQTKDFRISTGGASFPLEADYEAVVDGTDGDTYLEKVTADLNGSAITAKGAVLHVEGVKGRRITLDITTTAGRLEDFIKLTTRVPRSPMTGVVNVRAKLDIPPGEPEVLERMDLDGTFEVASARFASETIQARVDELSRRGAGRPGDETIDDVVSNLRGSFRLNDARMQLRSLSFRVQGAEVRLAGDYAIKEERLNFKGELRLQAKMSQTQTGWRSFVLKVFDPLFDSKTAGTVLPISITGTREQPKFGVDVKKALLR